MIENYLIATLILLVAICISLISLVRAKSQKIKLEREIYLQRYRLIEKLYFKFGGVENRLNEIYTQLLIINGEEIDEEEIKKMATAGTD